MVFSDGHGGKHSTSMTAWIPLFCLQLFFSRSHSFRVMSIFLPGPPTALYVRRHGNAFRARAPNLPLQASIWATPGGEISQPLTVQWSAVWRMKAPCCHHRGINFSRLVQSKKRIRFWLHIKHVKSRNMHLASPTSSAFAIGLA